MVDHRANYSIVKLFLNGQRMMDDYTKDEAVTDFAKLHPEADLDEVRTELDRELAKIASPA